MRDIPYRKERVEDGETIIEEGTWAYYTYVILSGMAKVVKTSEGADEVIATLKEGDVVGELAIIGNARRTASVVADGPVELAMIPRDAVLESMSRLSKETKSQLESVSSDLALLTHISATLKHVLEEINDIKARQIDIDALEKNLSKEIKDDPEILRDVFVTLAERLNLGIDLLIKLGIELEKASKSAESISLRTSSGK